MSLDDFVKWIKEHVNSHNRIDKLQLMCKTSELYDSLQEEINKNTVQKAVCDLNDSLAAITAIRINKDMHFLINAEGWQAVLDKIDKLTKLTCEVK